MMRAIVVPQFSKRSVDYYASDDVLTVTIGEQSDTFDFTAMPDGRAQSFETTLPICPVLSAERVEGVLTVRLLHCYGRDAAESEKQEREVTL